MQFRAMVLATDVQYIGFKELRQVSLCSVQMYGGSLQTFSLQQTDGEYLKSRIIYPTTSPSAHKYVSWELFTNIQTD